ncbi:hypothetical protein RND81_09G116100 [Saponaria officinalis]|uniref:Uncharacterized protein n=1 Tax=Saponaria officinalis TaxID=3572 RepID=A0AAW1ILL6_SAPOF
MSPKSLKYLFLVFLLILPTLVAGDCTCDQEDEPSDSSRVLLKYKIAGLVTILVSGALGVSLPIFGKNIPSLSPESNLFFLVKSFAAGVILSTGFIHVLPDAFESLTSPCLREHPWVKFPFTGLAAMAGALGTLMIDAFATGYYRQIHDGKPPLGGDEETRGGHSGHVPLHTHGTHGHAHGVVPLVPAGEQAGLSEVDRIRYKITSQVLRMIELFKLNY